MTALNRPLFRFILSLLTDKIHYSSVSSNILYSFLDHFWNFLTVISNGEKHHYFWNGLWIKFDFLLLFLVCLCRQKSLSARSLRHSQQCFKHVLNNALKIMVIIICYNRTRAKGISFKPIFYSSNRSLILFETDVLKNFAILTEKLLCWSFFLSYRLSGLLLKRASNTYAFCKYRKIFKNSFFYRTPLVAGAAFN